jgi:hypothetical protein
MILEVSLQIFGKFSNLKFHENPSNKIRVFPCGVTNRQTDMTNIIVAFPNFKNAPEIKLALIKE